MIVKRVEINIRAGCVPSILLDGQEFVDKVSAFVIPEEAAVKGLVDLWEIRGRFEHRQSK